MKLPSLLAAALLLALSAASAADAKEPAKKPNILFIAIDDLRDWVGYLGHAQAKTPHLDRLAARGVTFARSYCAAPVCNPSRTALMSGQRPSTTGVYSNGDDWRAIIPHVTTLPQHLRAHGYFAAGAGKIYHETYRRPSDWDEYLHAGAADADDVEAAGKGKRKGRKAAKVAGSDAPNDGVGGIRFKPLNCNDEDMVDYTTVSYCLKQLGKAHERPFFLACGLHKPHMGWDVPKKYYAMYPIEEIALPTVLADDLADIPPAGVAMAKPQGDHAAIVQSGRWKEAVQGYLAAITFCDAMIGRLLDGLDQSAYKDNTILCLWSDHGWHLREKEHWRKFALWEEATRAPFLMAVPGLTRPGGVCERTTDHMNIYPTLCDLAGVPVPPHCEGVSLRPLLADPRAEWTRPALTTHGYQNHGVRTEQWRYIRYANGDEELYDEKKDPLEWKNLAKDDHYVSVKAGLARALPATDAGEPGKAARKARKAEKK
jgi:arylsulfatase A-like enzyme